MKFFVQLEPYSLEQGRVGEPIYTPVHISRHRSAQAAARVLMRLIRGKVDTRARDYLAAVNNNPYPIALRYVARAAEAPFEAYSCADLRAMKAAKP